MGALRRRIEPAVAAPEASAFGRRDAVPATGATRPSLVPGGVAGRMPAAIDGEAARGLAVVAPVECAAAPQRPGTTRRLPAWAGLLSVLLHAGAALPFLLLAETAEPPAAAGGEDLFVVEIVADGDSSADLVARAGAEPTPEIAPPVPDAAAEIAATGPAPPVLRPDPEPAPAEPEPSPVAAAVAPELEPAVVAASESPGPVPEPPPPAAEGVPAPEAAPVVAAAPEPSVAEAAAEPAPEAPVATAAPRTESPPAEPTTVERDAPPKRAEPPRPAEPPRASEAPPRPRPVVRAPVERPREAVRAAAPKPVAVRPPNRAGAARDDGGAGDRTSRAGAASAAGAGTAGAAAIADYRSRVLAHLARHKRYPEADRDRGVEGRVAVGFTLARDGSVLSVALAASSGKPTLDRATLETVRRASPFPPIPPGGPASISFRTALRYDLR